MGASGVVICVLSGLVAVLLVCLAVVVWTVTSVLGSFRAAMEYFWSKF